ncbi:hypothetical protein V6N11_038033 [Hibiscus sabdariffa]|uniref:Uncharacterized protein n=2 Tax=Hibiscus sabdariffa TaxID=183260 RepID=A0ABR2B6L0_9ROSI
MQEKKVRGREMNMGSVMIGEGKGVEGEERLGSIEGEEKVGEVIREMKENKVAKELRLVACIGVVRGRLNGVSIVGFVVVEVIKTTRWRKSKNGVVLSGGGFMVENGEFLVRLELEKLSEEEIHDKDNKEEEWLTWYLIIVQETKLISNLVTK